MAGFWDNLKKDVKRFFDRDKRNEELKNKAKQTTKKPSGSGYKAPTSGNIKSGAKSNRSVAKSNYTAGKNTTKRSGVSHSGAKSVKHTAGGIKAPINTNPYSKSTKGSDIKSTANTNGGNFVTGNKGINGKYAQSYIDKIKKQANENINTAEKVISKKETVNPVRQNETGILSDGKAQVPNIKKEDTKIKSSKPQNASDKEVQSGTKVEDLNKNTLAPTSANVGTRGVNKSVNKNVKSGVNTKALSDGNEQLKFAKTEKAEVKPYKNTYKEKPKVTNVAPTSMNIGSKGVNTGSIKQAQATQNQLEQGRVARSTYRKNMDKKGEIQKQKYDKISSETEARKVKDYEKVAKEQSENPNNYIAESYKNGNTYMAYLNEDEANDVLVLSSTNHDMLNKYISLHKESWKEREEASKDIQKGKYEKYVKKGKSVESNGLGGLSDNQLKDIQSSVGNSGQLMGEISEDEINYGYYLLGKYEEDPKKNRKYKTKYDEYIKDLLSVGSYRKGVKDYQGHSSDTPVERFFHNAKTAGAKGIKDFGRGIAQSASNLGGSTYVLEDYDPSSVEYALELQRLEGKIDEHANVIEDEKVQKEKENKIGSFLYKALPSTSENALRMASAFVPGVGGWLSAGMTFSSVYGNNYNDLRNQGYSHEMADTSAAVSGVSEVITEKLIGGIPGMSSGKNAVGKAAAKGIGKVSAKLGNNQVVRNIVQSGVDEFTEEYLQSAVIDPLNKKFVLGDDSAEFFGSDALEEGLMGAFSGMLLSGISSSGTARTRKGLDGEINANIEYVNSLGTNKLSNPKEFMDGLKSESASGLRAYEAGKGLRKGTFKELYTENELNERFGEKNTKEYLKDLRNTKDSNYIKTIEDFRLKKSQSKQINNEDIKIRESILTDNRGNLIGIKNNNIDTKIKEESFKKSNDKVITNEYLNLSNELPYRFSDNINQSYIDSAKDNITMLLDTDVSGYDFSLKEGTSSVLLNDKTNNITKEDISRISNMLVDYDVMERSNSGISITKKVGNDTYTLGLELDNNEQRIVVSDYRKDFNKDNSNTRYHISSNIREDIKSVLKGEDKFGGTLRVRDYTPENLVKDGVPNKQMKIDQHHVLTTILSEEDALNVPGFKLRSNDNFHNLGIDNFIKAIDNMDSPVAVYKLVNDVGRNKKGEYIILTEIKDENGYSVIVPVGLKYNKKGDYLNYNVIKSIYGKKHLKEYIRENVNNGNIKILEKRSDTNSYGFTSLIEGPSPADTTSFNNILPQNQKNDTQKNRKNKNTPLGAPIRKSQGLDNNEQRKARDNKVKFSIPLKTNGINKLSEFTANNLRNGKNNLVMDYDISYDDFINNSINNGKYNKKLYIGSVSSELASEIKNLYPNHEVENYIFMMNSNEINHILKHHGKGNNNKDEIPVTVSDLRNIVDILDNPENLEKSDIKDSSNRDTLFFEKDIGKDARVVIGISKGKKVLALDTFYIISKKKKSRHTTNAANISNPRNHVQNGMVTSSNNSIPQNQKNDIQKSRESKVKFSIQKDNSGNEYVKVDTDQDIFEGISKKDYSKVAKMYMQDYLKGDTELSGNDNVNIGRRGINKYTNPGKRQTFFDNKMRLTPELKNVLKTAKKVSEGPPTKANSKYSNWEYYKFNFIIDGNTFSGIINIGIDKKGNRSFYEINNIKRTQLGGISGVYPELTVPKLDSYINILPQNQKNDTQKSKKNKNTPIGAPISKERSILNKLNDIAKPIGAEVKYIENENISKGIDGYYKDGVIYLSKSAKNAQFITFKHELVHYVRSKSESLYKELESFALEEIEKSSKYQTRKAEIESRYLKATEKGDIDYTKEDVTEEVVADFIANRIFENDEAMISRLAKSNRTLFERIRDFIERIKSLITKDNALYSDVNNAETLFGKVYRELARAENRNVKTGSKTMYHYSNSLNEDIDKVLDKTIQGSNKIIKVRDFTPEALVDAGMPNYPMYMGLRHIYTTTLTRNGAKQKGFPISKHYHYHGLGKDGLIKVIDKMDSPRKIYRYTDNDRSTYDSNNFILDLGYKDSKGNNIIVTARIVDKTKKIIIDDYNMVTTAYGKTNYQSYINNLINKGFVKEIKRRVKPNIVSEGINVPKGMNGNNSSTNSISQNNKKSTEKENKEKFSISEEAFTNEGETSKLLKELQEEIKSSREEIRLLQEQIKVLKGESIEIDTKNKEQSNTVNDIQTEIVRRNSENISKEEIEVIKKEYENAIDDGLIRYIENINKGEKVKPYHNIGSVSSKLTEDVRKLTGLDITGYKNSIDSIAVGHIWNRHGENGEADNSMSDINDIARIGYVLDNYDSVKLGDKQSVRYFNKDKSRADSIILTKRINGYYEIVEAVPDTKNKLIRVETAYQYKKKKQLTNYSNAANNDPKYTSETSFGNLAPSNESISQKSINNNSKGAPEETVSFGHQRMIFDEKGNIIRIEKREHPFGNSFDNEVFKANALKKLKVPTKQGSKQASNAAEVKGASKVINQINDFIEGEVKKGDLSKEDAITYFNKFDDIGQAFVNDGHYIEKFGKKIKNEKLKLYYNNILHAYKASETCLGAFQADHRGRKVGESVYKILEPVMDRMDDFNDYLHHRLNIDRWKTGKALDENVSAAESLEKVKEYEESNKDFYLAAQKVYNYIRKINDMYIEAGITSRERQDMLEELYPNYVPIMYKDDPLSSKPNKSKLSTAYSVTDPVRKAKGGGGFENIESIDVALARMTVGAHKKARANELFKEFYAIFEEGKAFNYVDIRKVDDIDVSDFDKVNEELSRIYSEEISVENGKTFNFYKDGIKYQMDLESRLAESVNKLNMGDRGSLYENIVSKGLYKSVDIFKKLQTSWKPSFILRNFARDFTDSLWYTDSLKDFLKTAPKAVKEVYKGIFTKEGSRYWDLYESLGGLSNSYFEDGVFHMENIKGTKKNSSRVRRALNIIPDLNLMVEQIPRITEFIKTLDRKGISESNINSIDYNTATEALWNADDITLNFGRGAQITRKANRYVIPFLNPTVQGSAKFFRHINDNFGKGVAVGLGQLMTRTAIYGIPLYYANNLIKMVVESLYDDDDEEKKKMQEAYDNLTDYNKNSNFLIYKGDGKFTKIPKGRIIGGIALVGGDTYKAVAKGEKVDLRESFGFLMEQINPMQISWIGSPVFQAINNRNYFGGDIESEYLQDLPVNERFDENTDEISKFLANTPLGKALNLSPKKINYVIDQYSGVGGELILPFFTQSGLVGGEKTVKDWLKNAGSTTWKNMWSALTVDTAYSNKYSGEYFNIKEKVNQQSTSEYRSGKYADKEGKNMATPAYLKTKLFDTADKEINELYSKQSDIYNDKKLSNAQKAEKLRNISIKINEKKKNMVVLYNRFSPKFEKEYQKNKGKYTASQKDSYELYDVMQDILVNDIGTDDSCKTALKLVYSDDKNKSHVAMNKQIKMLNESGVDYKQIAKYYTYANEIQYKPKKEMPNKQEALVKKINGLKISKEQKALMLFSTPSWTDDRNDNEVVSRYEVKGGQLGFSSTDEARKAVGMYIKNANHLSRKKKYEMADLAGYETGKDERGYYITWK